MNLKDLIILSIMTKKVEFVKLIKSQNDKKNHFCKACVLDKVSKIYSKTFAAYRTKLPGGRLHSDLFDDEKTFSDVNDYQYEVIVMNDHIRIKFLLILKSKDKITSEIGVLFNRMKTYTDRKIRFFRIDDDREFALLEEILNHKNIE
jgi:hypothetical protein